MHLFSARQIAALVADRKGVVALEYGILAAGIAVTIAGSVVLFGQHLSALYTSISATL